MALRASSMPSRIGKGRLDANSTPPPTSHASTNESSTPVGDSTGMQLTPSSFVTPEAPTQQMPAQSGHNAATPVININASRDAATEAAVPGSAEQPATAGSKWRSSTATTTGPVFSVISRGNRLPASTNTSFNPPPPPTKVQGMIARTISRVSTNRSSTSSTASSGINLRGLQRTPSTLSSSSSSSCAPTTGHPCGSRLSTGRLNSSSTMSARSCTATPVVSGSCKSVARVLSFEQNAGSPTASPAWSVHSTTSSRAAKPTAPAASKNPAVGFLQASSAIKDDVVRQLDQVTSSSSSGSTTWLSGGNEGSASPLSEFEASSAPPATNIFRMHSSSMPTAAAAPLPSVHDAASAKAAAKVLLQQLVHSASGLTATVGLNGDAALAAMFGSSNTSSSGNAADDKSTANHQQDAASNNAAHFKSPDHCSSSSRLNQLLLDQAAGMLETGATAQQVKEAVLPPLLLQLADLAVSNSNVNRTTSTGCQDGTAAAETAAADMLVVSVRAGLAAAHAAVQGNSPTELSSGSTDGSSSTDAALMCPASKHVQLTDVQPSKSRKVTALGSLLVLLWSSMLLATGFLAAAVLTVLESEGMLGGGSGSSGTGFCGVGPGGSFGVAADLCVGIQGAIWPVGGNQGMGWGTAAVHTGRRFGVAQQM